MIVFKKMCNVECLVEYKAGFSKKLIPASVEFTEALCDTCTYLYKYGY